MSSLGARGTASMDSDSLPSSKGASNYICCQRCHQLLEMEKHTHPSDETLLADLISDAAIRDHDSTQFQRMDERLATEGDGNDDLRQNLRAAAMEINDDEDLPLGRRRIVFSPEESAVERSEKLRLMELLSDISTIDHPVCASCTDSVMEELEAEIQDVEKECISYEYFLKQHRKKADEEGEGGSGVSIDALRQHLASLESEELSLRALLANEDMERQVNRLRLHSC